MKKLKHGMVVKPTHSKWSHLRFTVKNVRHVGGLDPKWDLVDLYNTKLPAYGHEVCPITFLDRVMDIVKPKPKPLSNTPFLQFVEV